MHGHLYSTELQNSGDETSCKLLLKKAFAFQQRKKQNQVNRTFWASEKAIKRNKEIPGGDVHIDFVTFSSPREMVYLLHSPISKAVTV